MPAVAERFEPTAESVAAARRYAVGVLLSRGLAQMEDDVRIVVSELATNAVLHAGTAFTVSLTIGSRRLRVAVSDGSPTRPRSRRRGDLEATSGRGLQMVAELSAAWGVDLDTAGKTTWCDLALEPDTGREHDQPYARPDATPDQQVDLDALLARSGDGPVQDVAAQRRPARGTSGRAGRAVVAA